MSEDMVQNDDITEWLDEVVKLAKDTSDTIMILEPDWKLLKDDVAEIFSPPRVVTVARRKGLRAKWSFDRLTEAAPGVPWDLT